MSFLNQKIFWDLHANVRFSRGAFTQKDRFLVLEYTTVFSTRDNGSYNTSYTVYTQYLLTTLNVHSVLYTAAGAQCTVLISALLQAGRSQLLSIRRAETSCLMSNYVGQICHGRQLSHISIHELTSDWELSTLQIFTSFYNLAFIISCYIK